jgi:hypothetical protein
MPRFIRHGVIYLNFDQVVRAQVGQNMTGRKTVKLFDNGGHEIGEMPEEAFLRAVEILTSKE